MKVVGKRHIIQQECVFEKIEFEVLGGFRIWGVVCVCVFVCVCVCVCVNNMGVWGVGGESGNFRNFIEKFS